MYNNDYMYGVERSNEYLAHYGIRGMKWGVRKAIKSGNSARLSKQYAKASKKLAKLEKRAGKTGKYAKRAALMGAGAAAAGGLAALGTTGVSKAISGGAGAVMKGANAAGDALRAFGRTPGKGSKYKRLATSAGLKLNAIGARGGEFHKGAANVAGAVSKWGNQTSAIGQKSAIMLRKGNNAYGIRNPVAGVTNNTVARVGAGVVGGALAVGAAKNAYRAATAKKKAAKFKSEMNKAFAGTQYANGKPRQGKKRRR